MTRTLYAVLMTRTDPSKYQQIASDLRARMESGEYPPGTQLPSITDMMEHYGAALGTMNSALRVLRAEGRVETEQGKGTFARKPPEAEPSPEYRELVAQIRLLTERMDAAEAWIAGQEHHDRQGPPRAARNAQAAPSGHGSSRLAAGTLGET